MKKTGKIISAAAALIIVAIGVFFFVSNKDATKVTASTVTATLEDASDCTTQKLIYQGAVKLSKGKIPIVNKSSFMMTYLATVRAGFDMSDADVNVTDDTIEVTIPKTEIQEITIDPDSLEFYDTSLSIFKPDGKESAKKALQEAKKDAQAKAGDSGLLEAADENAESLIEGTLAQSSADHEIVIKHGE